MIWDDNDDAWRYKIGCGAQAVTEVSFPALGPVIGSIAIDMTYDVQGLMQFLDEVKDLHEDLNDSDDNQDNEMA